VPGDLAGGGGVRRVGQVVTEPELDPVPWAAGADHHQAPGRVEPEQMGNGGEHVSGRAQPHPGQAGPALRVGAATARGLCGVHAARLG